MTNSSILSYLNSKSSFTSRFSIPFFMHPVSDMKLDCLPQCIDESNPKLYENITAGEYLDERLVELGLIKK